MLSGRPSVCPSVRPLITISHSAISPHLVQGFHSNLAQMFVMGVGTAEKVFMVRGQRSRKVIWKIYLRPALWCGTGYQTVWEIRLSAETPSSVHWRRFCFQLTRVHSALELSGRFALQIYLLNYIAMWNIHFSGRWIGLPTVRCPCGWDKPLGGGDAMSGFGHKGPGETPSPPRGPTLIDRELVISAKKIREF